MNRSAALPSRLGGRACSILLLGAAAMAGCGPRRAPDLTLLAPERIKADTTFLERTIWIDADVIQADGGTRCNVVRVGRQRNEISWVVGFLCVGCA